MIGMVPKQMFFDAKAVMSRVDEAAQKVLSKFGAFVRTSAKRSIRKRKAVSEPGSPPSSHAGLLRKFIYFGYDSSRRSVVIGPTPLHGRAEVPALLEYGGKARRRGRRDRMVVANYRARPFMGPAFERELPGLPAMWRNSVR